MLSPRPPSTPASRAERSVGVRAPGRLHLGFLDPAGSLGRPFGSLGLVIDGFETVVGLRASNILEVSAAGTDARAQVERAREYLRALQRASGNDLPLRLHLAQVLPAHAGFGSGTQLALAIGRAFATLHRLSLGTAELARLLGRGLRSGVGIAGFDHGGLLVDGGPGADGGSAPLLSRIELPADWRVLLVLDPRRQGLSGSDEKAAIASLPLFTREQAAEVCHEVLMRVLAGAAAGDFESFAAGVSRVQQLLGRHFAPAQGGSAYVSPSVARVCDWIAQRTTAAVGQSSWGPTGFAILPSQAAADALRRDALAQGVVDGALQLHVVAPRSRGAVVTERLEA